MIAAYIVLATVPAILMAGLILNFFFTLKNSKTMSEIKDALDQLGADIKANLANLSGDIDNLETQIADLQKKIADSTVIGALSQEDAEEIQQLFAGIKETTAQMAARVPDVATPPAEGDGENDGEGAE